MKNLKKRGFTLIEMLIVVVIIGILAAALIPRLSSARGRANDTSRSTAIAQIGTALGVYALDYGITSAPLTSPGAANGSYSGVLAQGGMSNIPGDPNPTLYWTFSGQAQTGSYAIFPVKKGNGTGFAIVAKVEAYQSANRADTTAPWAADQDMGSNTALCTSMTMTSAANSVSGGGTCNVQNGETDLRKIVVY